jgi:large subunit ribosomal protein L33
MPHEYVTLECTECKARNYTTSKETKAQYKLELKKYCKHERKRTVHKERKK